MPSASVLFFFFLSQIYSDSLQIYFYIQPKNAKMPSAVVTRISDTLAVIMFIFSTDIQQAVCSTQQDPSATKTM